MSTPTVNCASHGSQEFAIVCIHVCRAIDGGGNVGFFWLLDSDGPRPDVWCRDCELWRCEHPNASTEEWIKTADFQFLCVCCWDEAKVILYDRFMN